MTELFVAENYVIRPENYEGVAYSSKGKIVFFDYSTQKGLIWSSGGNYWSSRSQNYASSELEIFKLNKNDKFGMNRFQTGKPLTSGGKLSKKKILDHKEEINAIFGAGVAEYIAKNLSKGTTYQNSNCVEFADLFKLLIGDIYYKTFLRNLEWEANKLEKLRTEEKKKRENPELYELQKRRKVLEKDVEYHERMLATRKEELQEVLNKILK